MAANIQECIDDVVEDVGGNGITNVIVRMPNWNNLMFLNVNAPGSPNQWLKEQIDQRTVYDWAVPSIQANTQIQALGNGFLAANIAINVVLRTLLAVQAARTANRITAAQQTAVVTAYTAAWE